MAQERIEIKFIATGNVPLVKAIRELQKQTQKLNNQLNNLNKVNVKVAQTQSLVTQRMSSNTAAVNANSTAFTRLQSVISVYRNKMLLAGFAISLMVRPMVNMVAQAGKFEDLERGFDGLSGSIESSSEFLNKLREATDGTVDDMQLMQQANNAMMLGIVQSEDEMAQLFDTAQRLGQALGRDTVSSIESLVTGMGRQSRLMLDNLGIIVKSEDAYRKYALANNLASDSLSESQKKIAFNMEAMNQAKGIVNELGIETLSTTQHIAAMQVSSARLSRELGFILAPVIIGISKALVGAANVIEEYSTVLKSLIIVLSAAAVSFVAVRIATAHSVKMFILNTTAIAVFSGATVTATGATFSLTGAIAGLTKTMMANPYLRMGAGILLATGALVAYFKWTEETEEAQENFNKSVIKAKNVNDNYKESVQENVNSLKEELDLLNADNDMMRMAIKLKRDLTVGTYGLHESEIELFNQIQAKKDELKAIEEQEKLDIKRQENIAKIISEVATMHEDAALTKLKANLALIETEMQYAQAIVISNMLLGESSKATLDAEAKLTTLEDTFATLNKEIEDYGLKTGENITVENKLLKAYDGTIGARIEVLEATIAQAQATALSTGLTAQELAGLVELVAQLNKLKAARDGVDEGQTTFLENTEKVLGGLGDISSAMSEMANVAASEAQAQIDVINELADAEIDSIRNAARTTIAEEKKTRSWQRMSAKQQANFEKKVLDGAAKSENAINERRQKEKEDAAKKANKLLLQQFKLQQALSLSEAFINTYTGVTAALKLTPPMSFIMAGITLASGLANVALISKQKPPTMEAGGLIGGKRHSQGGTIIEAEQGEFVMSRNAVQSVGIETMNRINSGGGGGSVNISFEGNVLSKDFIEDEAIPQIKEALRRGGDIGVS